MAAIFILVSTFGHWALSEVGEIREEMNTAMFNWQDIVVSNHKLKLGGVELLHEENKLIL